MLQSFIMKPSKQIVDSAFLRSSNYSYIDCNDFELSSIICYALARHRKDLILHQQRIDFLTSSSNPKLIYTAIIDLFIALDDKGHAYKKRIYSKYNAHLTSTHKKVLSQYLDSRLSDNTPLELEESILSLGLQGNPLSSSHL